jgi:hypothetical protein
MIFHKTNHLYNLNTTDSFFLLCSNSIFVIETQEPNNMTFKIPLVTNTSIPNFIIRYAEVRDTALVFDFIKQLAVSEKMIDDVVATEEILKESLFGEFNGYSVDFALFFKNASTFLDRAGIFLEDLFFANRSSLKRLWKNTFGLSRKTCRR